jgi:tripartite-type tricarboxylate transporter receptor subunit TctC
VRSLFGTRRVAVAVIAGLLVLVAVGCGDDDSSGGGAASASADDCEGYPSKDVEFIIPSDPGGGFDTWGRILAPALEKTLPNGPNVLPINRPGAGTLAGTQEVYGSKPDGTRVVINDPGTIALAQITGETEMDLAKFTAIGRVATTPEVIVTGADSEYDTIESLVAAAEGGEKVRMGTAGLGASNVVALSKVGMPIPFEFNVHDGSGEAALSVVRGDTAYTMFPVTSVLDSIKAGDLKPLVVVGATPASGEPGAEELAGVPTIDDLTGESLGEVLQQHRIVMAPPGTPDCMVEILSTAMNEALADPEVVAQAEEAGLIPAATDAAEARALLDESLSTYEGEADVLKGQLESQ